MEKSLTLTAKDLMRVARNGCEPCNAWKGK